MDTLTEPMPSFPVLQMSKAFGSAKTGTLLARMAQANPAVCSGVNPYKG